MKGGREKDGHLIAGKDTNLRLRNRGPVCIISRIVVNDLSYRFLQGAPEHGVKIADRLGRKAALYAVNTALSGFVIVEGLYVGIANRNERCISKKGLICAPKRNRYVE